MLPNNFIRHTSDRFASSFVFLRCEINQPIAQDIHLTTEMQYLIRDKPIITSFPSYIICDKWDRVYLKEIY